MRPDDRIRKVGFNDGFFWLMRSLLLTRQGMGGLVSVGALWLLLSMVAIVPFVGQLILAVITPLLTAGVLVAFDQVSAGKQPTSSVLLAGWHRPKARPVLILLGMWTIIGAMVALSFVASWLGTQVSEAELQAALAEPENLVALIDTLTPGMGLYLAGLTVVLVLMGLYFAIPLSVFGEARLWPAIRASLKAIVVNPLAFIGFVITAVVLVVGFVMVLVSMVGLLMQLPGVLGVMLAQILILVMAMALQLLLAGAQYLAFCDIFGWTALPPEPDPSKGADDEMTL